MVVVDNDGWIGDFNAFLERMGDFTAPKPGFIDSRTAIDMAQHAYITGRQVHREIDTTRQPVEELHGWLIARPNVSPFFVPASHPEIVEYFRTELATEVGTTVTRVFTTRQPKHAQAFHAGEHHD